MNKHIGAHLTHLLTYAIAGLVMFIGFSQIKCADYRLSNIVNAQNVLVTQIWTEVADEQVKNKPVHASQRKLHLNYIELKKRLSRARLETTQIKNSADPVIPLPLPDGTFVNFTIYESPIYDSEFAKAYPDIKTYIGHPVDYSSVSMRCDITPDGFHATVLGNDWDVSISPTNNDNVYVSKYSKDNPENSIILGCGVDSSFNSDTFTQDSVLDLTQMNNIVQYGASLRQVKIAFSTTWEFSQYYGKGTSAGTAAAIVSALSTVNALYERDLAVRLVLVNTPNFWYSSERGYSATSDPFTNGNAYTILDEVNNIMSGDDPSWDIGHVLGTYSSTDNASAAGLARIASLCSSNKNRGVTMGYTQSSSLTSEFSITLAHEIGHQFGSHHTFNSNSGACGQQRNPNTAYESGAGLTIMSYAGSCSPDNYSTRSFRFHAGSILVIQEYLRTQSCYTSSASNNKAPSVSGGYDYNIPKLTPFTLTAQGYDPDISDTPNLTYVWEQLDAGSVSYSNPPWSDINDPAGSTRPIFRPYDPLSNSDRTFPKLDYILKYSNTPPTIISGSSVSAERLPAISRQLNFGVTIKDNRSGGGGSSIDTVTLNVFPTAGPFQVQSPNAYKLWKSGSKQTITWSVNNTNVSPINCTNVKISLSIDDGLTYPYVLEGATPNDGSQEVTIPTGLTSSSVRIKIEAVGNVFFDVSDSAVEVSDTQTSQYLGVVESVKCDVIKGWAADKSRPGMPIVVNIYDRINGVDKLLASVLADKPRADIATTTGDAGNHGYELAVDQINDGSEHTIIIKYESTQFELSSVSLIACPNKLPFISSYQLTPTIVYTRTPFTINVTGRNFTQSEMIAELCRESSPGGLCNDSLSDLSNVSIEYVSPESIFIKGVIVNRAESWRFRVKTRYGYTQKSAIFNVKPANDSPLLFTITPGNIQEKSPTFELIVNGLYFASGSVVRWNGNDRTTTFVSASQLKAVIPSTDIATAAIIPVTVFTPAPGGGTSAAINFIITSSNNPVPVLSSVSPSEFNLNHYGKVEMIKVLGSNYVPFSKVHVNNLPRTTTYVSDRELQATLDPSDIANNGYLKITVVNGAPGGGVSAVSEVPVLNPVPVADYVSPLYILAGTSSQRIFVSGTKLARNSKITIDGKELVTELVNVQVGLRATLQASDIESPKIINVAIYNPPPGGGYSTSYKLSIVGEPNPVPKIASLSPSAAILGGAAFTLTIHGSNFIEGANVYWNNKVYKPTSISATQIEVLVPAIDIRAGGEASVSVYNPTPGGGQSNIIKLRIASPSPIPQMLSISPSTVMAGRDRFTLIVNGADFTSSSVVEVNGSERVTTYRSPTQLTALITDVDISNPGVLQVGVKTPLPGGGASATLPLTVTGQAPVVSKLLPSMAIAGSQGITLVLTGVGFSTGSTVQINDVSRATTYISATQLSVVLNSSDFDTAGVIKVVVVNQLSPNSNAVELPVYNRVTSVSAASYTIGEQSPDSIIAAFGIGLATGVEVNTASTLPTTLRGTKVVIKDSKEVSRDQSLFFVAPGQINYHLHPATADGMATVTVYIDEKIVSLGEMMVGRIAPAIFTQNATGDGVPAAYGLRVKGSAVTAVSILSYDNNLSKWIPEAIDLGPDGPDPDVVYLVLFGTGLRSNTGATSTMVKFNSTNAVPVYAGEAPGYVGLDQMNVVIPRSLIGAGLVNLEVIVDGKVANQSKVIQIRIK